ncbi:MAG: cobalamin biosynthesis protein CobD [Leifsonia xyli]|nr:MAG: cobalamin biosynthesis protein CobD [Leifsonia xyli]
MALGDTLALCLGALAIEALWGYPRRLYALIGHPVTWIGRLIELADRRLNDPSNRFWVRRALGVATTAALVAGTLFAAFAVTTAMSGSILGSAALSVILSTLFAQRSLHGHVAAVASGLDADLAEGRAAVAMIVGRDCAALDEAGVARAAIESLAENFSDGVVAPAFWAVTFGLPGALAYKAVNTADSMIGHRSSRHLAFGWAAARSDDLANLPPARISALLIVMAAMLTTDASPAGAWAAISRDARSHRSPNAGWPEAAMAGALGLKLNGPRVYSGVLVDDAYMGAGRRNACSADIRSALQLYRRALAIQFCLLAALMLTTRF